MRIMTVQGSPRRRGNTATILDWMEQEFRTAGHEVEHVDIVDRNVCDCGECRACQSGKVELCAVADDANDLFRAMARADLVLFASPVFCWGFPAQLKALMDRTYCLMDLGPHKRPTPFLDRKPLALLLTSGGEEKDNAELVIRAWDHLVTYLKAHPAGHLLVTGCLDPKTLGDDVLPRAQAFARELLAAPRVAPAT